MEVTREKNIKKDRRKKQRDKETRKGSRIRTDERNSLTEGGGEAKGKKPKEPRGDERAN